MPVVAERQERRRLPVAALASTGLALLLVGMLLVAAALEWELHIVAGASLRGVSLSAAVKKSDWRQGFNADQYSPAVAQRGPVRIWCLRLGDFHWVRRLNHVGTSECHGGASCGHSGRPGVWGVRGITSPERRTSYRT